MTFKDFIKELEEKINLRSLYFILNKPKNKNLKKLLKIVYINKKTGKIFKNCSDEKLKKILNIIKNISINTEFIKIICNYINEEDLKNFEEIKLLKKEELNKNLLKRIRKLLNNCIINNKNAQKKYSNLIVLKELVKILIDLHNILPQKAGQFLNDNAINFEKLKFFDGNLKWILNRSEILSVINFVSVETLKNIKKGY